MRINLADLFPDVRIRGDSVQLKLWVSFDEADELTARVTAGTGDRNAQDHGYSRIVAL
ncbi:unannotated protein [freshwater metagenome]|uniref:Unannotated protein n=1 Tax=freshwater metagenome TaxID=449393 RepID=A0A6J6J155_9ZZZZ